MGREPIEIRPCASPADVAVARELFLEYAAGLDFSLDYQGFDEELATLRREIDQARKERKRS